MKVLGLSGSVVGSKTVTALRYIEEQFHRDYPEVEFTIVNLADYDIHFSDGRNYLQYEGDTSLVIKKILEADAIMSVASSFIIIWSLLTF
ncbi:NAD(P)H-dependent oxidoreductase [Peribacillus simplex]|uniref:NAD(P)H-dependent oxidoreductase n=1 Tax=Peribacillus simplex TaxID=1478 RepID=UPI0038287AFE